MKKHINQWDEIVLASSLKAISMKVIKEARVSMIALYKWLHMQLRLGSFCSSWCPSNCPGQRKARPIEMLGREDDILPEVSQHTDWLLGNMVEKVK